jgi:hypothetical protein
MPLGIFFWVIYLIAIFASYWFFYEANQPWFKRAGGFWVIWLLVGILGWQVFGPAIK